MSSSTTWSFWPYDYRDCVVLGWKGLLVGVLVADVAFFLFWMIPSLGTNPGHASYTLSITLASMIIGLIPIAAVGLAVAWPLGLARTNNQRLLPPTSHTQP